MSTTRAKLQISQADYNRLLAEKLESTPASKIVAELPDIHSEVSELFHNAIIEEWKQEQMELLRAAWNTLYQDMLAFFPNKKQKTPQFKRVCSFMEEFLE